MKDNFKKAGSFIIHNTFGFFIGLLIAGTSVYAATVISGSSISYNNSNSTLTSTNVQGALDELYEKSTTHCPDGYVCTRAYLKDLILAKNPLITANPNLKASYNKNSPADASGLYSAADGALGGTTYYFRGAVNNNYVSFAGLTWRIVRINGDGTVKLILQDGLANNTSYIYNSTYDTMANYYFSNSPLQTTLGSWFTQTIKNKYGSYVASGNYYCESVHVRANSAYTTINSGMDAGVYTDYTPTFSCYSDRQGKWYYSSNFGLLSYDEAVFAGLYPGEQTMTTYLYNGNYNFYTMSPAGYDSTNSTYVVWMVDYRGMLFGWSENSKYLSYNKTLRPVINLKADTIATGSGTSTDPYVVK